MGEELCREWPLILCLRESSPTPDDLDIPFIRVFFSRASGTASNGSDPPPPPPLSGNSLLAISSQKLYSSCPLCTAIIL